HSFYLHGIHYITASQDVIDWNKDAQVCYLPQNKELTYYSHYLQDNCLQECKLKK
ncbi:Sodium channel protein Nachlike, partial [Caligus rogercresseyi]